MTSTSSRCSDRSRSVSLMQIYDNGLRPKVEAGLFAEATRPPPRGKAPFNPTSAAVARRTCSDRPRRSSLEASSLHRVPSGPGCNRDLRRLHGPHGEPRWCSEQTGEPGDSGVTTLPLPDVRRPADRALLRGRVPRGESYDHAVRVVRPLRRVPRRSLRAVWRRAHVDAVSGAGSLFSWAVRAAARSSRRFAERCPLHRAVAIVRGSRSAHPDVSRATPIPTRCAPRGRFV